MQASLSRCLLATILPLLLFFLLYSGFLYAYLLQHEYWSPKDWGYLVLLIATVARIVRFFALEGTINYSRLLRWRALGYDAGSIILAPVIFLPVVGFVLVVQPEFLLMLLGYCSLVVATKLLLEYLWEKSPSV